MSVTRLDCCQFLISSQTNFTLTYYAEHATGLSHGAINRYLSRGKMRSYLVWDACQRGCCSIPIWLYCF